MKFWAGNPSIRYHWACLFLIAIERWYLTEMKITAAVVVIGFAAHSGCLVVPARSQLWILFQGHYTAFQHLSNEASCVPAWGSGQGPTPVWNTGITGMGEQPLLLLAVLLSHLNWPVLVRKLAGEWFSWKGGKPLGNEKPLRGFFRRL